MWRLSSRRSRRRSLRRKKNHRKRRTLRPRPKRRNPGPKKALMTGRRIRTSPPPLPQGKRRTGKKRLLRKRLLKRLTPRTSRRRKAKPPMIPIQIPAPSTASILSLKKTAPETGIFTTTIRTSISGSAIWTSSAMHRMQRRRMLPPPGSGGRSPASFS